jgi:hypothetical protein
VIALDHIVVAALSLDEGARWVKRRLHAPLDPGGQHLGLGTHNALLRLGSDTYLEVLAPDPAQPNPARPRLFGLDEPATRVSLAGGPRLLHWVVRADHVAAAAADLAAAAGLVPAAIGVPTSMRRGDLAWVLTIPPDGSRPPMGLPSVIDWGGAPHPCSRLPDRDVRLERLEIAAPAQVVAALAMLVRDDRICLTENPTVTCSAHLATRHGAAVL